MYQSDQRITDQHITDQRINQTNSSTRIATRTQKDRYHQPEPAKSTIDSCQKACSVEPGKSHLVKLVNVMSIKLQVKEHDEAFSTMSTLSARGAARNSCTAPCSISHASQMVALPARLPTPLDFFLQTLLQIELNTTCTIENLMRSSHLGGCDRLCTLQCYYLQTEMILLAH
jgi:hypothetical protein